MQTEIKQAIAKHKQLEANIGTFEDQGAACADAPSHTALLKESPIELTLQIESSTQLDQKIFVTLEKNH